MSDLKRLIQRSDHTYFSLAKAVGVQPNTIYRWASGRAHPSWRHAQKLAKALRVDLAQLGSALAKAKSAPTVGEREGRR